MVINSLRSVVFVLIAMLWSGLVSGQVEDKSGSVCWLDSIGGPEIICNMGELHMDNYVESPPTYDEELIAQQPSPLCPNLSGTELGQPHNTVWYAFVAESTDIELRINWINGSGIHAGIYSSCDFSDETSVACGISQTPTTNLYVDLINDVPLVVGEVYYLFIDAINSTQPRYKMELINPDPTDSENFNLEEIDSFSNDAIVDGNICLGVSSSFVIDPAHEGYQYQWIITNTDNITTILDTMNSDKNLEFIFNDEGNYQIRVRSLTACDTTAFQEINFNVSYGEAEVFDEIKVCLDCFPIEDLRMLRPGCIVEGDLHGQDPNADGISGWIEETRVVIGDAWIEADAETSDGCKYKQRIYIEDITSLNAQIRDTLFCDLPVMIDGQSFEENDMLLIAPDGSIAVNCNAAFEYTVKGVTVDGDFNVNCDDGKVDLSFVIDSEQSNAIDNVTYSWTVDDNSIDATGSVIVDAEIGKKYEVVLDFEYQGLKCSRTFTHLLESDDLTPSEPIIDTDITMCNSLDEIILFVDENGNQEYNWNITTPGLSYTVFTGTTDTITVNNPERKDFKFEVTAFNDCGDSEKVTGTVSFIDAPAVDIDGPEIVCKDSIFALVNTSDDNVDFTYEFIGVDGMSGNVNIIGDEATFRAADIGTYVIKLSGDNGNCITTVEKSIEVIERPSIPVVECNDDIANQLSFTWEVKPWMTGFMYDFPNAYNDNFDSSDEDNGRITFKNLQADEEIEVTIFFDYGAECGLVSQTISCTSRSCPPSAVTIKAAQEELCHDENMPLIKVTVDGYSGSGIWDSPYIDDQGNFDPNKAGVGQHVIYYQFNVDGCPYETSTRINVLDNPSIFVQVTYAECDDESGLADAIITGQTGIGKLTLTINGKEEDGPQFKLEDGIYDIHVEDKNGCSADTTININNPAFATVSVDGPSRIKSFDQVNYTYSVNGDFNPDRFEWTLNDEVIGDEASVTPEIDIEQGVLTLCVSASEGDCTKENCLDIDIYTPIEVGMPNAITPNGDRKNDELILTASVDNTQVMEFAVYDRLGNKMHSLRDFTLGKAPVVVWNGKYKEKAIAPGVYVYMLKYLDENQEEKVVLQDITIF